MKKILILISVIVVIVVTYLVVSNKAINEEGQNYSIKFSGKFTPEEIEKILSENLTIEEIKEMVGEENVEIKLK